MNEKEVRARALEIALAQSKGGEHHWRMSSIIKWANIFATYINTGEYVTPVDEFVKYREARQQEKRRLEESH